MRRKKETADQLVNQFLSYHENVLGHSPQTIKAYQVDMRDFLAWASEEKLGLSPGDMVTVSDLSKLQKIDIYAYLTYLSRERRIGHAARARHLAALRAFFRYLTEDAEKLSKNPTLGVRSPKIPKRLPAYLTANQAGALLGAATGNNGLRDRTMILLLLTCGLRVSELVGLDLDRVSTDAAKVIGKGNKERILYFSEELSEQMSRYLILRHQLSPKSGHEKALFLSRCKTRISIRRIQSMLEERLSDAGLSHLHCSPHALRHTSATLMLQNGVDIRVISEILGHEQLGTTQIYTHVEKSTKQKAASTIQFF